MTRSAGDQAAGRPDGRPLAPTGGRIVSRGGIEELLRISPNVRADPATVPHRVCLDSASAMKLVGTAAPCAIG